MRKASLSPPVGLSEALAEFRLEPREVQLISLPQIGSIRLVYLVEPVHELVRDLLAEHVVEPLGQSRCDGHAPSPCWTGPNVRWCRRSGVGKRLREGADCRRAYARRPRRVNLTVGECCSLL